MSKVHKCRDLNIFVYVEDTDFQGIVYHANYLKYFERARSSCLKDLDISQTKEIEGGKVFIVKTINIEFVNRLELRIIWLFARKLNTSLMPDYSFINKSKEMKVMILYVEEKLRYVFMIKIKINQLFSQKIY